MHMNNLIEYVSKNRKARLIMIVCFFFCGEPIMYVNNLIEYASKNRRARLIVATADLSAGRDHTSNAVLFSVTSNLNC
jgi:hypothetical protein